MLWWGRGAKGTIVFWANRSFGVPRYRASPLRPAVRRPDPYRPWYVRILYSTNIDNLGFIASKYVRNLFCELAPKDLSQMREKH